jgi:hypothetical protein
MIGQIFVVVIGIVLWEHFGRIFHLAFKPSIPLAFLADQFIKLFTWLGAWAAKLSSYLIHLKLDELWPSIKALAKPCLELAFSWWHFWKSYMEVAMTYSTPLTVFIGTLVLVAVIGFGLEKWNPRPYQWICGVVKFQHVLAVIVWFIAVGLFVWPLL